MTDTPINDPNPARVMARNLYWQGHKPADIARTLGVAYPTVDSWRRRDKWDQTELADRVEALTQQRLLTLILKADKSATEVMELDKLKELMTQAARVRKYGQTGREGDISPEIAERNAKRDWGRRKKREGKNTLTAEQIEALRQDFESSLFAYQWRWYEVRGGQKTRLILKSRQVGATWYFAREALIDALTTGDNQIFLSASKAQALVFREYIVRWVREVTGVELSGTPIVLPNGGTLYFLGTNARTAQSYHGHLYVDEYAWIGRFDDIKKVASGMASHKKWRMTYMSTPSAKNHQSYDFWTGKGWNKGRPKSQQADFDVSHAALREGALGPDGIWRHIVTVVDAAEQGCDLFDLDQLRAEYSDTDFQNLFMCQWLDDTSSFFSFAELQRCLVDSLDAWQRDWSPDGPFEAPVWIGYDPSRMQDNAAIVVIAPPAAEGGVYRIIHREGHVGVDFVTQAQAIQRLCETYTVAHIGIDATAIGEGVYDLVRQFYPAAVAIRYSPDVKARMVNKTKHLISRRLLQWDAGDTLLTMSFLAIRKVMTATGRQATYIASRSEQTGHADFAWAAMNALDHIGYTDLPLDAETPAAQVCATTMEYF